MTKRRPSVTEQTLHEDEDDSADLSAIVLYCKEVGQHRLLSPADARTAAEEIERLDLAVWDLLLGYRPGLPPILPLLTARFSALDPSQVLPPLTAANRGEVAQKLRAVDPNRDLLCKVMDTIPGPCGDDPFKQHRAQVRAAARAATAARDAFLQANLRLVIGTAARYQGRGLSLEDLIQEGNLGLMRALGLYEVKRGFRFSTFANWWIRSFILRAVQDHRQDVRVPGHRQVQRAAVKEAHRQLSQRLGRRPHEEEIAQELGVSTAKADQMRTANSTVSLETPVSDAAGNRDLLLGDTIPAETPDPLECIAAEQWEQTVLPLLDRLRPMERQIVLYRFGFGDYEAMTLAEVGQVLGLSRERIRQVEKCALNKLRQRVPQSMRWA